MIGVSWKVTTLRLSPSSLSKAYSQSAGINIEQARERDGVETNHRHVGEGSQALGHNKRYHECGLECRFIPTGNGPSSIGGLELRNPHIGLLLACIEILAAVES